LLYFSLYAQHLAHQAAVFSNTAGASYDTPNRFGGAGGSSTGTFSASGPYAPNFAGASSSFGPQGFHQTAAVYPANPVCYLSYFRALRITCPIHSFY